MTPRAWYALAALVTVATLPVAVLLLRALVWAVRDYMEWAAQREVR